MTTDLIVSTCKMVSNESDAHEIWICKTASYYHSHDLRNNRSFVCLFVYSFVNIRDEHFHFMCGDTVSNILYKFPLQFVHTSIEILVNDICSDQLKMCIIIAN